MTTHLRPFVDTTSKAKRQMSDAIPLQIYRLGFYEVQIVPNSLARVIVLISIKMQQKAKHIQTSM